MKKILKAALCFMLALMLMTSAALAAGQVNVNLYPRTDYNDPDQRNVQSAVGIGDTLYLLINGNYDSTATVERWQAGMEAPETVVDGLTYYLYNDEGKPADATNISNLFTDGKTLYAYDSVSGSVRMLVDEAGKPSSTDILYKLDRSGFSVTEDEYTDNGQVISLFADGNALYLLTETYGRDAQKQVFSQYDLATGALTEQKDEPKLKYATPYQDGKLLVMWQESEQAYDEETGRMIPWDIAVYDPAAGTAETVTTALNFGDTGLVYSAQDKTAYFVSGSTVYSLPGMQSTPKVSAYLPSQVWQGSGQSFSLLEGGMYVYASYQGALVRVLNQPGIENGALTIFGEYSSNAHNAVVAAHPEMALTVSDSYYDGMESLTAAMLSGEDAVDVLRLSTSRSPLERLIAKGYAADLNANQEISGVVDRMDPRFTEFLKKDGKLYGLPVGLSCNTMGYNREVWEETLGLTEDDLPATFMEFLDFAANFYADYGEDHPEVSLIDNVSMRSNLLQMIMDQYVAVQMKTEGIVSFDTPLFRKLLAGLDAIDFTEIDPYAEQGDDVWSDEDAMNEFYRKKALFTTYFSANSPQSFNTRNDVSPLVLPMDAGLEPVIPVSLDVMILNPRSTRMEQAGIYLGEYAKHYDESSDAIVLFPDNNEPVPNRTFEQDKKSYEDSIARLNKQLESADEENKAEIRENIKYLQEWLDELENNRMNVSDEMIAKYRELISPYLYVMQQTPLTDWSSESSSELQTQLQQYYAGAIDAETFIREIDKRVKMMMLEDQ